MTVTTTSSAPLIAVTGATGNQGGSVIAHLIASSRQYRIRAITRDGSKPAAQKLKEQEVEIVEADIGTKEGAKEAFEGADYVFAVTNFWAHTDKQKEIDEGKVLADAAKAANVKLFIWSGLEDVSTGSDGKFTHVDHFDSKAIIADYVKSISLPILNVRAACYAQNFEGFLKPQKLSNDSWAYMLPLDGKAKVHWIDIEKDYGNFVVSALETDEKDRPEEVNTASWESGVEEVVKALAKHTGQNVKYIAAEPGQWEAAVKGAGVPEHIVEELSEMWQWFGYKGYYGGKDTTKLKLQHETQTIDGFFEKAKDTIKAFYQ